MMVSTSQPPDDQHQPLHSTSDEPPALVGQNDILSRIVGIFLQSNLSILLILFALIVGWGALVVTPREEDPQIVVPLADIHVSFPGHSAMEVEQLVATPLERILYQIDGVEYVYSMSQTDQALITVRFYVGQDRERSLVKLRKKIDENLDSVAPGVTGWMVKPVEIDDVPIVTLTLTGAGGDTFALRRVAEELVGRMATVPNTSRALVIGGESRVMRVDLDLERLRAYNLSPLEVRRAIVAANVVMPAGQFNRNDAIVHVEAGFTPIRPDELGNLVIDAFEGRPVFLKDVAVVQDGAAEATNYVRHGWGPARDFAAHAGSHGTLIGTGHLATRTAFDSSWTAAVEPAITLAFAKQQGTNAVTVARDILRAAEELRRDVVPDNVHLIVTRNAGLTSDDKVNELIEGLCVAVVIVIVLLTMSLGWREAIIVAVAVPVVFGLTLAVNYAAGYTINRVTLFALILAIGLLVDDPIVDVENISRHFAQRGFASRRIVLEAVAEIRPPLISATLAVILSFLPLFFITGMMGPYMAPMALNVPVSMVMSMIVAFTITPWLSYHLLKGHAGQELNPRPANRAAHEELYDTAAVRRSILYRLFRPLMAPLLAARWRGAGFLMFMVLLTAAALGLGGFRLVPLKMLPFDNKNELLLVLDFDEGTTVERTDAALRAFEVVLAGAPEVSDFTSYAGVPSPIDFNGLVRHYYLRRQPHLAEIRVNLVGKKSRAQQSHGIALRLRNELSRVAAQHHAALKIVELPPGPPVLAALVAEVYGRPDQRYEELIDAARIVHSRLAREPGVADVDDVSERLEQKLVFVADQQKAALAGVSVAEIAETIRLSLNGGSAGTVRVERERNPLNILVRLPRESRSSAHDLTRIHMKSGTQLISLGELGRWQSIATEQSIYHKNLQRVVYVFGETVGRTPAECIADILSDRQDARAGFVADALPRPVATRTFLRNGGGIAWSVPAGIQVDFAGEGEWKITLDVFRDLGLAFAAAMVMIYVVLVAQTGSFLIPIIVMLAIPLTVLGVMPGFYSLNLIAGQVVDGYANPIYFTATAMIGMIALAGIVTRDSIILVDFIELARRSGRSLFDAILESRVVRLRPILLTAGAAMLSSIPITFDPIFSGLGWSLIFGLVASTLFTLFVIPIAYWLIYSRPEDRMNTRP